MTNDCTYRTPDGVECSFRTGGDLVDFYTNFKHYSYRPHENECYCMFHHPDEAVFEPGLRARALNELISYLKTKPTDRIGLQGIIINHSTRIQRHQHTSILDLSYAKLASLEVSHCMFTEISFQHCSIEPSELATNTPVLIIEKCSTPVIAAVGLNVQGSSSVNPLLEREDQTLELNGGVFDKLLIEVDVNSLPNEPNNPKIKVKNLDCSELRINANSPAFINIDVQACKSNTLNIKAQNGCVSLENNECEDATIELADPKPVSKSRFSLSSHIGSHITIAGAGVVELVRDIKCRDVTIEANRTFLTIGEVDDSEHRIQIAKLHLAGSVFYTVNISHVMFGKHESGYEFNLDANVFDFTLGSSAIDGTFNVDSKCEDIEVFKLRDCQFSGPFNLSSRKNETHLDIMSMDNCIFKRDVKITSAKISSELLVSKSEFNQVPSFEDTELPTAVLFDEACTFSDDNAARSAARFRVLRRKFEEKRARGEEGFFFMHEQRALRKLPTVGRMERLASYAYDTLGRYGRSFIRPMGFLILLILLMAPIYGVIMDDVTGWCSSCSLSFEAFKEGLFFSFQQATAPLLFWRKAVSADYSLVVALLGTLHSLISITLIAMAVIALRWRFRRA